MCGIFGIINFKKRKFDKRLFNTLGVINDIRGGDSCGVFIDGEYDYGIDKEKLYKNFFVKNKLINDTEECNVAIGHCRKASVGVIDKFTAQPVVILNDEGQVDYVLMHNGTIYNYEELAKKYIPEINIKGLTDSQVMAHIFYHKGYDSLSEYIGAAVFFIIDYRNNKTQYYFFQGLSKSSDYVKTISIERPIYLNIANDHITFSSIESLFCSLDPEGKVHTLTQNYLITIDDNNELKIVSKHDRSDCSQSKPVSNYIVRNNYGYRSSYFDNSYNNYNYDEDDIYYVDEYKSNNIIISYNIHNCMFESKGIPVHGFYYVNEIGKVGSTEGNIPMWFFNGYVLYNKECFDFLTKFMKEFGAKSVKDLNEKYPAIIRILSVYPYFIENGQYKIQETLNEDYILHDKEILFLFTCFSRYFNNGKYEFRTSTYKYGDSFQKFIELSKKEIDFTKILIEKQNDF